MFPEISRVTRSKGEARANYDRLSRRYDALAHASEWPLTARGLRMLNPQAGEAVLEIGCGTGHALVRIAQAAGRAYGLDLSSGMLAVARKRASAALLVQGDAGHMPYAPASLDVVFMSFTLELFDTPEIPAVLAECRRVLRPGGRIGVVALAKGHSPAVRLYEWAHRRFPRALDCRPILVHNVLEQAGFQIVACETASMWGLAVEAVVGQVANGKRYQSSKEEVLHEAS